MATKQAAMPDALWKKRRRERPCLDAIESAMSIRRASTSFCCAVWCDGRYSSLETTCVGTGDGKAASSAGSSSFISSSFRKCMGPSRTRHSLILAGMRIGALAPGVSTEERSGEKLADLVHNSRKFANERAGPLREADAEPRRNALGLFDDPIAKRPLRRESQPLDRE